MAYNRKKQVLKIEAAFDQMQRLRDRYIGDILITAKGADAYDPVAFNKKVSGFLNGVVKEDAEAGVVVISRSESGRLHAHCAVSLAFDPSFKFDWVQYDVAEATYRSYQQTKDPETLLKWRKQDAALRKSLDKAFKEFQDKIQARAKNRGLGKVKLLPIRKNAEAYMRYLISNVAKKRDERDFNLRLVRSWGVHAVGPCQLRNKGTRAYTSKLKRFSTNLSLTSDNYSIVLKVALGSRWFYYCKDIIFGIDSLTDEQQTYLHNIRKAITTAYKNMALELPASVKEGTPLTRFIKCEPGAIYFSSQEWNDVLTALLMKRPDLVEAFKKQSIQNGDHFVVLKDPSCVFHEVKNSQETCVLRHDLNIQPLVACCN